MKRRPTLVLALAAFAISCAACSAAADEPPTTNPADPWVDEVHQLQLEIASDRGTEEAAETRTGGGHLSAGAETSLRFDPIVSGPITASFLCAGGTVSVSMAGGPGAEVECGQVETFSSVEPYEFGTGLMVSVGSEQDVHWAVEFRSKD